ncbi:MAG: LysR family transcriptional regulator [Firmicutes bacterium]|nr:LysR family transcriptional regulator [Bacillota bacterium]
MELRVLRYFLAVVREESISGAANFLHITQPTLSRQIMDLENELGTKLIVRGNRNQKITLTEKGVLLKKRAEELIELADKTESEIMNVEEFVSGDIYVGGSGVSSAMAFISKTARSLQLKYPNIRYHLYSGNSDDIIERLEKGLLDFGIIVGDTNFDKFEYIPLPNKNIWGLLMPKDSIHSEKEFITPKDLADMPIIVSRQAVLGRILSKWFGRSFDRLNIVSTYNLIYNAVSMVEEGVGYAVCLDNILKTSDEGDLCFRPFYPYIEMDLNLVWKKDQVFSPAAEQFFNEVQSQLLP